MTDFLVEVVVISFTLGGIVGGIVAVNLGTFKKPVAQSSAEEKTQNILRS